MITSAWRPIPSRPIVVSLAMLLSLVAHAGAETVTVHDARERDVVVADQSRIVSIGGAITEIIYALGLQRRLVGVDTTSLFPSAALRDNPNVGYMRQLSAEGVLGLNPTLILAMQGSGPRETMDILDAAKVPMVVVPEAFSPQSVPEKIRIVGHALAADAAAQCLIAGVTADLNALQALRGRINQPVRVMFVMSLLNGRVMAAGRNTAANEIIALAGAINAIDGYDGYKTIGDEAIIAARPDVVLSMDRGRDSVDAQAVFSQAGFAMTPVAANKAFVTMDGLYLLGFGPRTAAAARDLVSKLYPSLAADASAFGQAGPPQPSCVP